MANSKKNRKKYFFLKNKVEKLLRRLHRRVKKIKREYTENKIIKFLDKVEFGKVSIKREEKRTLTIKIPKDFSFNSNPDECIEILKHMYYCGMGKHTRQLKFDHSSCDNLGICASTVMDVILLEIRNKRRRGNRRFSLSGMMPENDVVREILEASGMLKHLGFEEPKNNRILKLELQRSLDCDVIGTRVVQYFLKCLATQGFTLKLEGKSVMGEMVGEVINNCKLHSGEYGRWFTLGHYFKQQDKLNKYGECHLVIFNFGRTIYEGLSAIRDDTDKLRIKQSLEDLYKKHKSLISRHWTKEALWTLYALQDGISRLRTDKDPDRGTGTIKLIESFQSIGGTANGRKPIMSITSGHVHIVLDGKYRLKEKDFNGEKRQIIAFNEENDLYKKPDKKYVQILKNFFPGTIISMRFYLDKEYLSQHVNEGENHNGNRF
ncbi:hypothetical protein [Anaerosinus sp.]